jgi:hypothetical protein
VNNLHREERGVIDPQRRRRCVKLFTPLSDRDVLFLVGFLHGLLLQEEEDEEESNISTTASSTVVMGEDDNQQQQQQQQKMSTGLILQYDSFLAVVSEAAVAVICDFLQQTTCTLPDLHLSGFPPAQFRRLLIALHTNTSVKEFKLCRLAGDSAAAGMAEVLRHKTDFTSLAFQHCINFDISRMLPFLRHGPAILQTLDLSFCMIGDDGTRRLVDAFVNNSDRYTNLKKMYLNGNGLTPNGLRDVCRLDVSVLPNLECLNLGGNDTLLDDRESTECFAQ